MPIKTPKKSVLTIAEREVLKNITEDFLTPKQVQHRRGCSRQAVYKILKKLREKGYLNTGQQKVDKIEAVVNQRLVRLHGQEFNIKILFQNPTYQKLLKRSNILFLSGHTIKLYRNSVEVYAGEGTSFYGDDAQEAIAKSLEYWKKFFVRLENELKCVLVKPRSRNIRQVNSHFARGDSEISENAVQNNQKIKIFAQEDGKLCYITDNSFNMYEDETVHPKTAKKDREAVDKQVNDWRLNNPPTNSYLNHNQQNIMSNQQEITKNLTLYAENIQSHIKAIQDLGTGVNRLTELIEEMEKKKQ